MVELKNQKNVVAQNSVENKENQGFKASTFTKVHASKTAPVQACLDKQLSTVIGTSFVLVAIEEQNNVDSNTGELRLASIYTVRVISKHAKAFRDLIQIKVKNVKPIIKNSELDKVMLGISKPIVLRFDDIAHYAFMGGETLNATSVERLDVSVQEAMEHE